jgi:hypothetical protein
MAITRLGSNQSVNLASNVTGTLPIANGGTAVTTAAALANTGNFVLIKSIVASGSSSIEFINGSSDVVIDSTYRQYILKGSNVTASANGETYFAIRESGAFQGSNYARIYSRIYRQSGSGNQDVGSNWSDQGTVGVRLEHNYTGQSPKSSNYEVIINNPDNGTLLTSLMYLGWGANQESEDKFVGYRGGAYYRDNGNAVDGFRFKHSGGNLSGTFSLYGVKA